ncbi:hypothetical protein GCM10010106_42700 [Thermopolyspora flexuosa]|nr:hypothetical protein GCM10010106_42700 [Thermopolyspora flexuosa]
MTALMPAATHGTHRDAAHPFRLMFPLTGRKADGAWRGSSRAVAPGRGGRAVRVAGSGSPRVPPPATTGSGPEAVAILLVYPTDALTVAQRFPGSCTIERERP